MSGKPAARQGDMTQYGGPSVQGSAGVRIGAPTGVACSVCPGGMNSGNPVNPLLGAKVLPGETDVALPGPLPFILSLFWQLPDEDACAGGRFRPRLESAF
ncbi:hypothetical protein DJICPGNB_05460 [Escherichia coli]|nr:hypothetical protein DJICPGNB_05460 [Escherichia coli]